MPRTVLSSVPAAHALLVTALSHSCYYSHLTNKLSNFPQRSSQMAQLGFEPRQAGSRVQVEETVAGLLGALRGCVYSVQHNVWHLTVVYLMVSNIITCKSTLCKSIILFQFSKKNGCMYLWIEKCLKGQMPQCRWRCFLVTSCSLYFLLRLAVFSKFHTAIVGCYYYLE